MSRFEPAAVDGRPGLLVHERTGGTFAIDFDIQQGRIGSINVVRNPDKPLGLQRSPGPRRIDG